MRRTLIIIATVIVLAGAGVAGYFYFFADTAGVIVAPEGSVNLPISEQSPVQDTPSGQTTSSYSPTGTPVSVSSRLVRISEGPVVLGMSVINRVVSTSSPSETVVNYIERQSGNVYSYLVGAGTLTRTNNKTVPGIQSAVWFSDASTAFVRYLSGADYSTINTYALRAVSSDTTPAGGQGFFLAQNLSGVSVSSSGILTLSSGVNGSIASLSKTDGTGTREIFTTPLSSLRVDFAGKNRYLAYSKPSARIQGSAFIVDGSGTFSRVAGPLSGLVAKASPSGKWLLVSHVNGSAMQMSLVNTATGESLALPVATIADKCVWTADDSAVYCGIPVSPSPNFSYPDDWYQGAVSFSDRIWKIDVSGRYAQFVLDFVKENNSELDATALSIDPLSKTLVFINKKDGSLWSYSL